MAKTYYYCDGNTRKSTSVTMSEGITKLRNFTIGDNTTVYESYKDITFTFSPTVNYSSESGLLVIYYNTEFRTRLNYGSYSSWNTIRRSVIVPSSTSTLTKEVIVSRETCYSDGSGDEIV